VIERHRVELTTAAQKDLKSYRHATSSILDALARLEFDPERGHSLAGELAGVRSLEFTVKGSGAFRVAYEIDDQEKVCIVVAIGPRERFYERLRRRLNG
jgi:mRNA-degrading endonuclease RelE of RelBE toxin-antitoxin system